MSLWECSDLATHKPVFKGQLNTKWVGLYLMGRSLNKIIFEMRARGKDGILEVAGGAYIFTSASGKAMMTIECEGKKPFTVDVEELMTVTMDTHLNVTMLRCEKAQELVVKALNRVKKHSQQKQEVV